ncbi:MAG: hypothetical protein QOE46_1582 [Acidobacteriota bacterium]|jgi:hypothetical protein|nr:hypothetical protein [Acidobacteriota bacterium]
MKRIVNAPLQSLLALVFVVVCTQSVALAQVRDVRVISAHAGGVNFVSGDVEARRAGESGWSRLSMKNELASGDDVRTGANGRVEILLNPGSYFRAGGGAEFTFSDSSLEDLRLELSRGSAVVEATGYSDLDLSITIATPRTLVRIIRSGVYRIDVTRTGAAEVSVLKGRAVVGGTLVKGGKLAREGAGVVEVAKLDKDNRDELDLWSRERGKALAKANDKLSHRSVYTTLAQARTNGFNIWGSGGGLWYWNGLSSCYTFLPFYGNWQSPYGFWYGMGYYYPPPDSNLSPGYTPPTISRGGAPYNPPPIWSSPGSPSPDGPGRMMPDRTIDPPRPIAPREGAPAPGVVPHRDQR